MEFRIEPRLLSFGVGSRDCDATSVEAIQTSSVGLASDAGPT